MSVIHSPRKPKLDPQILVLPVCSLAFLIIIFMRLWYFQVVLAPDLADEASHSIQSSFPKLAPRGLIYDRDGNLLAGVHPELVITVIPKSVKDNPWILDKLGELLNVPASRLKAKLLQTQLSPKLPAPIFIGAPIDVATKISESPTELPGVQVETQPMRYYPDSQDFTNILGNVWVPDKNDVKRLTEAQLRVPPYVGKFGVEWAYEKQLMGSPGTEVAVVDQRNQPVRIVSRDAPVAGSQLILGIDSKVQKIAEAGLKGHKGAVVAIDPNTGEVLCLATAPSFDLNLFDGGISSANYKALATDPDHPFTNRAVNSFSAPGSTFKIVTSLAMLRANDFNVDRIVYCPGYLQIGKGRMRDLEVHGPTNYGRAIEQSCNVYFSTMGLEIGPDAIREAAHEFGLDAKTEIDLRSELGQMVIPDDAYIAKVRKPARWYGGDTANMSIGQGFVAVSPLQMADVIAGVASRGTIYKPHLVRAFKDPASDAVTVVQPEVLHHIDAPDTFWDALCDGLRRVIASGTGQGVQIPGIQWAGKTGTAEHGKGLVANSWFVGYAPYDHPMIAIAVMVEAGGHGADIAAPIARDCVKGYLEELNARSKSAPALASKS